MFQILDYLEAHKNEWINNKQLQDALCLSQGSINNSCRILKDKEFVDFTIRFEVKTTKGKRKLKQKYVIYYYKHNGKLQEII